MISPLDIDYSSEAAAMASMDKLLIGNLMLPDSYEDDSNFQYEVISDNADHTVVYITGINLAGKTVRRKVKAFKPIILPNLVELPE